LLIWLVVAQLWNLEAVALDTTGSGFTVFAGHDWGGAILEPPDRVPVAKNTLGLMAGFVLDSKLSPSLGIDWGTYLVQKSLDFTLLDQSKETMSYYFLWLNLLARVYFIPAISGAFGFYGGYPFPISLVSSIGRSYQSLDYGVVASLQLRVRLVWQVFAVGDIRYVVSLTDLSKDEAELVRLLGWQGFVGLRVGL
jgi:hypothetical protein